LEISKTDIEAKLEHTLTWERLDHAQASRIALYQSGSIEDSAATLADTKSWMIANLRQFKMVFGPRIVELMKQI
jgi:hypothetical protein